MATGISEDGSGRLFGDTLFTGYLGLDFFEAHGAIDIDYIVKGQ